MIGKKSTALLLLALGGISTVTSLVIADTYPGANAGGADNKAHWACWVPDPDTPTISSALWNYLFGYLDDEVNTSSGITVPWSASCEAGTDMFLDDRLSNANLWGLRTCRVAIVNGICSESSVMINDGKIVTDATNAGLSINSVRQFNWCHEGGHSLGLNHDSGSNCMRTGLRTFVTYNSHDLDHFDNDL